MYYLFISQFYFFKKLVQFIYSHNIYALSLFLFLQTPVMLSTPSNAALPINILSISNGACITLIVQYIPIPKQTIQPATPQTLLELMDPLDADNILLTTSPIFILIYIVIFHHFQPSQRILYLNQYLERQNNYQTLSTNKLTKILA